MSTGVVSQAWSWRHAIIKSDLAATTRHILLTLSVFMNGRGEGCFPSIAELADASGLSARAVMTHIEKAVAGGWLVRAKHGFGGRKWRRNEYVAAWPGRDGCGEAESVSDDAGGGGETCETEGQGGEPGSPTQTNEVVNVVPQGGEPRSPRHIDQSNTSPKNPPSPPVGGGGGENSDLSDGKTETPKPTGPETPSFEDFKTAYGADPVMNWAIGERAWDKLKPSDKRAAVAGVPGYLAGCRAQRQRVCGPAGFLRGRRFAGYGTAKGEPEFVMLKSFGKTWFRYFFDQFEPERRQYSPSWVLSFTTKYEATGWQVKIGEVPDETRIAALIAVPSDGPDWAAWKTWLRGQGAHSWPDWRGYQRWLFVPTQTPAEFEASLSGEGAAPTQAAAHG